MDLEDALAPLSEAGRSWLVWYCRGCQLGARGLGAGTLTDLGGTRGKEGRLQGRTLTEGYALGLVRGTWRGLGFGGLFGGLLGRPCEG